MANAPYGGSVGQVASNQLAMSAQERAAQEALVSRLLQQIQLKRGNERQDRLDIQDQRNTDRDYQLRRDYFGFNQGQAEQSASERTRVFDERLKLDREYLDLAKNQPTTASLRAQEGVLALAAEEADNGIFDPVNYSTLTAEQKAALLRRRDIARQALTAEHAQVSDFANARNRINKLKGYVALSNEARKDAPNNPGAMVRSPAYAGALGALRLAVPTAPIGWLPDPVSPTTPTRQDIDANVAGWNADINSMQAQADAYVKKGLADRITQDPATGDFRPAMGLPWAAATNAPVAVAPVVQKVKVMKDGQQFWLPASQLSEAQAQGYQLVPQQ